MTAPGFRCQAPALIRIALLVNCTAIAGGAEISGGWDFRSKGDGWQTLSRVMPTCNGLIQALVVEFPWNHRAEEGDFGALVRPVELCGNEGAKLSFTWSDNFAGPTAGCHFAQVTLDGRVVWEADVAGKTPEARVCLDLSQANGLARAENATSELGLRVATKRTVTNFGVAVRWSNILLEVPGRPAVAIASDVRIPPADVIPNELPLPGVGPAPAEWHRQAIVLQPWGKTQHAALAYIEGRPRRLRDEFGFNALIVLPPAAHNAITEPSYHLTDEQFRKAIEAFREAGYKLILYSSVMHCGHAPEWQSGQLGREHEDWSQRGPNGETVTEYGAPWLCPNTPALEYTIAYTERIVREFGADAVMLDNNQFFHTQSGWTCHCDCCRTRFQEYLRQRFSAAGVKQTFGIDWSALRIPTEEGPLRAAWLAWRNRVWAEANEGFRRRLRSIRPDILFFGNTQYLFSSAMLATDLQYEHQDMLLSESRGLTSRGMSEKMLLGQALSAGRPVWNYIGTFDEGDFQRLRPAEVLGPIVAATLGHQARPWIVYYGFTDRPGDDPGRAEMARLVSWCARRPELFSGTRWATAGAAISTRSRDLFGLPVIPNHLGELLARGVPTVLLREGQISTATLQPLQVLTLENADCLDREACDAVADWVRAGGKLIATVEAGWFDALGRIRPRSTLWDALALESCPTAPMAVGDGKVIIAERGSLGEWACRWTDDQRFQFDPQVPVELIPYRSQGKWLLHLVRHGPVKGATVLRTPPSFVWSGSTVFAHVPGESAPRTLAVERSEEHRLVRFDAMPPYSVVELRD